MPDNGSMTKIKASFLIAAAMEGPPLGEVSSREKKRVLYPPTALHPIVPGIGRLQEETKSGSTETLMNESLMGAIRASWMKNALQVLTYLQAIICIWPYMDAYDCSTTESVKDEGNHRSVSTDASKISEKLGTGENDCVADIERAIDDGKKSVSAESDENALKKEATAEESENVTPEKGGSIHSKDESNEVVVGEYEIVPGKEMTGKKCIKATPLEVESVHNKETTADESNEATPGQVGSVYCKETTTD